MASVPALGRPDWLTSSVPTSSSLLVPLSPSQAYDESAPRPRADASVRRLALARGVAMHRLLQSRPDLPPERREEAATRYLARMQDTVPAEVGTALVAGVLRLLGDPRFHALFAPGSRAEVPVVGRVEIGGRIESVAGVLDRLAVTADAILIADYKTNRPPPATPPDAYVAQLALYRAVLARLYPGKPIRAALIWTETPDLVELSDADMDATLRAFTSRRASLDAPEGRS
jgi:ATP-dependent helicase/nuclease subunit A